MANKIQEVSFKNFNGFLFETKESDTKVENYVIAGIQKQLLEYNYKLSEELFIAISKSSKEYVESVFKEDIFPILHDWLGDKGYKPLFTNFPEDVTESNELLFLYQCLHYMFGLKPEDLGEEERKKVTMYKSDVLKEKSLSVVTEKQLRGLLISYLTSNIVLSESNIEEVKILLDYFGAETVVEILESNTILMKETMVVVYSYLANKGEKLPNLNTATDVLRLIAYLSKQELNTKHVTFEKFSRPALRSFLTCLENIPFITDDMLAYKKVWKNFFRYYAGKMNLENYPHVKESVDILFGVKKHKTFASKLSDSYLEFKAMGDKSLDEQFTILDNLLNLYCKRPGDFSRKLVTILSEDNLLSINNSGMYVVQKFLTVISEVNSRVLYQLLDRVNNIHQTRFIKIKGTAFKIPEKKSFDDTIVTFLQSEIKSELRKRASLKEGMGLVYIDPKYKEIALTTSQKFKSNTLNPMTSGSKFDFEIESDVLRMFVYWKDAEYLRTDIDASYILFDESFNVVDQLAYFSERALYHDSIKRSGDIVSAPNGAIEFLDIDLKSFKKYNTKQVKYAMLSIASFSKIPFDMVEAKAGLMQLSKSEATFEQNYKPSAVTTVFDVSSTTFNTTPFIIDLENNKLIWLDVSFKDATSYINTQLLLENNPIGEYLNYIYTKNTISLYDVLAMNAQARGVLLEELPENRDNITVFEYGADSPVPLAEILSEYL